MKENSLSRNTIILSIGALITNGLQFIMVPFFSRWLSTAEYGLFDLCITYVTLLLPMISLATGEALFRFSVDNEDNIICQCASSCLAVFCVGYIIVAVPMCLIANHTGRTILYPFCLLLMGQLLNIYCQALVRGLKKLVLYSLGSVISTLSIAIFVLIFVFYMKMSVVGIVLGYALGALIGDIVLLVVVKIWNYISVRSISIKCIRRMIEYSLPLIPNNISWWVLNTSDRVIISSFFALSANGIYAIAHKVPGVCSNVFGMFNLSWQQSATEVLNKDEEELKQYYYDTYNNLIQQIAIICAGVLSLNSVLYHVVFDSKYAEAAQYSPILIASMIFNSVSQYYGGIMISLKKTKDNGLTTLASAIVNICMHIVLIRIIGLYAAAISTLIANMFLCFARKVRLKNFVKCSLSRGTCVFLGIFVYYFFLCYIEAKMWLCVTNIIVIAMVFFLYNRRNIIKFISSIHARG